MSLVVVYVKNNNGKPLMPCSPARAKHLLKAGEAKVIRRVPFVIQLTIDTQGDVVQPIVAGMDTGSRTIGCAAVGNGLALYQSEVVVRQDVSKKMKQRMMFRRNRRSRKTRYRQPRWCNRSSMRKSGRIAPSMISKIDSHLREKKFVESILPITRWIVEIAQFDIHRITNPDVSGKDYQNGVQKDFYNAKAYVLHRDGYRCQSGKKDCKHSKKLHVHHILERHLGGADAPENLLTLCQSCHDDLHAGNDVFGLKKSVKKKVSKTRHATHVNVIQSQLQKVWDFEKTYGYETKYKREKVLKLPKSHANDAIAICCRNDENDTEIVSHLGTTYHKRHVSAGDYQQTKGSRSEKSIPTGKLFGFRKFDLIKTIKGIGFVKGKRSSGHFALENIFGDIVTTSVNVKKGAKRLCARSTTLCSPCLKAGVS